MADTRSSLQITLDARDNASAKVKATGDKIGQVGDRIASQWGGAALSVLGLSGVLRGIGVAMKVVADESALAAAIQKGSADEVMSAHVKVQEAWQNTARSLPGIGEVIASTLSLMGDTEGLRRQAEAIRTLSGEAKKYIEVLKQWQDETEILTARNRGATESEIALIQAWQRARKEGGQVAEMEKTLNDRREEERIATEALIDTQDRLHKLRLATAAIAVTGVGFLPALAGLAMGSQMEASIKVQEAALAKLTDDITAQEKEVDRAKDLSAKRHNEGIKAIGKAEQERHTKRVENIQAEMDKQRDADEAWGKQMLADAERRERGVISIEEAIDDARLAAKGDAIETELAMVQRKYDRLREQAWEYGADYEESMAMVTDLARAEHEERAKIADRATRERLEKAATGERTRLDLVTDMLRATGKTREAEMIETKRSFDALREKHKGDWDTMAAIDDAEKAKMAEIKAGASGAPGGKEVRATVSRFLTYGADRADPGWVKKLEAASGAAGKATERAIDSLPAKLKREFASLIGLAKVG